MSGALTERTPSELDLEHSRSDIAMVGNLAARGLLTGEQIDAHMARLLKTATTAKSERLRHRAEEAIGRFQDARSKIILQAEKLKQAERFSIDRNELPAVAEQTNIQNNTQINNTQINVSGGDVRAGIQELLNEPEYVEWLRQRNLAEDCDPGAICQIRESGQMADGTAPRAAG